MDTLLHRVLKEYNALYDEPLSGHTTFKVGGPADALVEPPSREGLLRLLQALRGENARFIVIGNGSNLLFSDCGYRGVVVKIGRGMSKVAIADKTQNAEAGALLSDAASAACKAGLSGLEFASGIPGTVGGAIFMNAGAYGGEIKDIFLSAEIAFPDGSIKRLDTVEMNFGYRSSAVQTNGAILLSTSFRLHYGEYALIKAQMDELAEARASKQPLDMPSAGSVFRRPPGYFAGKLIMDCGLCGYSIGGAQVSEKHCGFIVNKGNATCDDVLRLIAHIQEKVLSNFNVELTPEIRVVET